MCSFVFKLFKKTTKDKHTKICCVAGEHCCAAFYVNDFFPRTARLWNSLPIEGFSLTYDQNGFKSRINIHLLIVGSF